MKTVPAMIGRRRPLAVLGALIWLFVAAAGGASAAEPSAPPPGPPYPEPIDGQAVYDYAGVFDATQS